MTNVAIAIGLVLLVIRESYISALITELKLRTLCQTPAAINNSDKKIESLEDAVSVCGIFLIVFALICIVVYWYFYS